MKRSFQKKKILQRERRKRRTREKFTDTATRPRLSVFRSLKHISAQIIDDEKGVTLVSANDRELAKGKVKKMMSETYRKVRTKEAVAFEVGKLIAQKALAKKIFRVVFDRGERAYHGRIQALAEGAREQGLKF